MYVSQDIYKDMLNLFRHVNAGMRRSLTVDCVTGTQEQCSKALEHLEKIIRHKAAILKVADKNRTEPRSE